MERLGRAPASDAVSTGISACRHVSTKANWGRFLDFSVPIASLISELSPLPAKLPVSKCYDWRRGCSITFVREYSATARDHCGGPAPVAEFLGNALSDAKTTMAATLDAFLKTAWADHGDHPQDVAERLADSIGLIQAPEEFAPYVRLVTHVYGEHLGHWQGAVGLLDRLRALPAFGASPEAAKTIDQAVATMRFAAGETAALDALPLEARVSALATAASALSARDEQLPAIAAFERALELAEAGLPEGSAANRALAVAGNNMAAVLEGKVDRDAVQTAAMLVAAHAGLKYWKLAGTWLEEERAEYRLARSQLQAGTARDAVASAQRCIAVCRSNGAPAFEQFFGFAVLALAQRSAGDREASDANRAEALRQLEQVSSDERQWCGTDLAELSALD